MPADSPNCCSSCRLSIIADPESFQVLSNILTIRERSQLRSVPAAVRLQYPLDGLLYHTSAAGTGGDPITISARFEFLDTTWWTTWEDGRVRPAKYRPRFCSERNRSSGCPWIQKSDLRSRHRGSQRSAETHCSPDQRWISPFRNGLATGGYP